MTGMEPITDTALIVGATMRLTRLVVTDDIGEWWIKEPLTTWIHTHKHMTDAEHQTFEKYFEGLNCPFCCGFWIGAGVLASHSIAKRAGMLGAWRFVASAFTLNEVAAHANVWIGDV